MLQIFETKIKAHTIYLLKYKEVTFLLSFYLLFGTRKLYTISIFISRTKKRLAIKLTNLLFLYKVAYKINMPLLALLCYLI